MAIEQWGIFNLPHLLWHVPTLYNVLLWGPGRRYMAEILPIRRKTLYIKSINESINQSEDPWHSHLLPSVRQWNFRSTPVEENEIGLFLSREEPNFRGESLIWTRFPWERLMHGESIWRKLQFSLVGAIKPLNFMTLTWTTARSWTRRKWLYGRCRAHVVRGPFYHWLIDWLVFYAVWAIFQSCNRGVNRWSIYALWTLVIQLIDWILFCVPFENISVI